MAAPVRIEAAAFGDPRFDILGQLLGTDRYGALGVMAHIWSWATERSVYEIPISIASVFVGMQPERVAHIVTAGLAELAGDSIRIRGSEGRVEWLGDLRSMRVAGGKARIAGAVRGADGRIASSSKLVQQAGSAGTSRRPAPSSALTPVLALDPDPVLVENTNTQKRKSVVKRARPSEATPSELEARTRILDKLTKRNKVVYEGSKEHTRLIVARIRERCAQGKSEREAELELRFVVGYCAAELGWATTEAEKMARYLRPETLFGPETFYRYLEPARAWADTLERDEHGEMRLRRTGTDSVIANPVDNDQGIIQLFASEGENEDVE